jgi:hypothetical protein
MKISPITVLVWCIAIAMIAITYGLSKRQPTMETVEKYKVYRDGMRAEQLKWRQAVDKVKATTALGRQAVAQWNQIAAAHTMPAVPDPLAIDLSIDGGRLAMQMPAYRNKIQAMINTQVKAGGVTVIQGPVLPPAPTQPDTIVASYFHFPLPSTTPVLVFDLGNITVTGTYQQIADNVRAWKNMPHFLAVADGLRLNGTSPKLTGTYTVSIVGFVAMPKDPVTGAPKAIFPPLPEGSRIVSLLGQLPPAGGAPPAAGGGAAKGGAARPGAGKGARVPGAQIAKPGAGQ